MFNQYNLSVAQVLVTKPDFQNDYNRANLKTTLEELIRMRTIPIVNANDVVAPTPNPDINFSEVSIYFIFLHGCKQNCLSSLSDG